MFDPENATVRFSTTAGVSVTFAVAVPAVNGATPRCVAVPSVNETTYHRTLIVCPVDSRSNVNPVVDVICPRTIFCPMLVVVPVADW
jgi:hypothetical protein